MKPNFTNDDFEKFIKQQADQLRMRPSDKVWNNISGDIHSKRRWIGLGLLLFLVTTTSVSTYFLLSNNNRTPVSSVNQQTNNRTVNNNTVKSSVTTEQNTIAITNKFSSNNKQTPFSASRNHLTKNAQSSLLSALKTISGTSTAINAEEYSTNSFQGTFADSYPYGEKEAAILPAKPVEQDPQSIESVINKYKGKKKRISWQFYFTPTVSYRKLTENKSYLRKVQQQPNSTTPNYAELYNINDVVTHKPDIGLELGAAAKYEVSRRVTIRAGLQFNLSHYDIKAFDNYYPKLATIALNAGSRVDSVNTVTNYSNFSGATSSWLQNYYFQISAPVGVDVVLAGNKNVQFGISSTIQPTYVLGERAYLISSDYQSYTKVPWLMRKWNVNTSLETFVSYSTGQLKWQIGPQVRYQLLSSFVNEYPVKENLFDFGLKVGVGLNK